MNKQKFKKEILNNIYLNKITTDTFFSIFDKLVEDESTFVQNRTFLLKNLVAESLYGLAVCETDNMFNGYCDEFKHLYCENTFNQLPCLCVIENDVAIIMWVHTKIRSLGLGSKFIEFLKIKEAKNILPESKYFWQKMNVKEYCYKQIIQ